MEIRFSDIETIHKLHQDLKRVRAQLSMLSVQGIIGIVYIKPQGKAMEEAMGLSPEALLAEVRRQQLETMMDLERQLADFGIIEIPNREEAWYGPR